MKRILERLRLKSSFLYYPKEERFIEYSPSIFRIIGEAYHGFNDKIYKRIVGTRLDSFAFLYEIGDVPITLRYLKRDYRRLGEYTRFPFFKVLYYNVSIRISALFEVIDVNYFKRNFDRS